MAVKTNHQQPNRFSAVPSPKFTLAHHHIIILVVVTQSTLLYNPILQLAWLKSPRKEELWSDILKISAFVD